MKLQDVMLKAMAKGIRSYQAAEILGIRELRWPELNSFKCDKQKCADGGRRSTYLNV
jgi:hypothetical protein